MSDARLASEMDPPGPEASMDEIRRWALERALAYERGDKPRAARRLGIALKTLYNWQAAFDAAAARPGA